jgi:cytochrome c oxidase subunit IV
VNSPTTQTAPAAVEAHDDHHPSDWEYLKVAGWLALLTLIEVGTYFESVHNLPRWALFVVLSVLMVVKFVMVGAYFMHLKYDTPWFRRLFIAGLVLAIIVYMVFFLAFDLFGLG